MTIELRRSELLTIELALEEMIERDRGYMSALGRGTPGYFKAAASRERNLRLRDKVRALVAGPVI